MHVSLCRRTSIAAITVIMLLSALSLASCGDGSAPADTYADAIRIARTETWRSINVGEIGSASVAVMDGGEIVYSEGFAMADREGSTPVDTETLFNIGSVSKTFCAVAVMLLVDDGVVELDAPVTRYLPEFVMEDPRHGDITVRMLLDHTSGLPGSTYANNFGYQYNPSFYRDTLENLSLSRLKADPGEAAPYCNDGFTLAEMLVARVSGGDYIDFLEKRIFKPLSLGSTGLSVGERHDAMNAAFYRPDSGERRLPEVISMVGAGGLSSTAEDLARFAYSFCGDGPQVLSASAIEEMTRAQPSRFAQQAMREASINPELTYGLGLDITDVPAYRERGVKVIGKGGDTDDYHSMIYSVPEHRLAVAVVQSGAIGSATRIALDMLDSILVQRGLIEKEEEPVSLPAPPEAMPERYLEFSGCYAGLPKMNVSFDVESATATLASLEDDGGEPMVLSYRDGVFDGGERFQIIFFSVGEGRYAAARVFADSTWMIMGERLPQLDEPLELALDLDGKRWLRRNVETFERGIMSGGLVLRSRTYELLPGYVDFGGMKVVRSPMYAGMVSKVLRDISELTLYEQDGITWARTFDRLYSPAADAAAALGEGKTTVAIGGDGYSQWLEASRDLVLSFEKPAQGRVIVLSPDGKPVYDSIVDEGEVVVSRGGLVVLAGQAGDVFSLEARG
jgi:CubicO group peptidase (beta-lactamase class C family)